MFELEEPIFQQPDLSIFYMIIMLILLFVVFYILFKLFKKFSFSLPKKRIDIDKVDLNNPKEAAYLLSEYADLYAKENPYYDKLKERLKEYKYKKEVPHFDSETLKIIQNFKEAL